MRSRRKFTPEFKAKVALEALAGEFLARHRSAHRLEDMETLNLDAYSCRRCGTAEPNAGTSVSPRSPAVDRRLGSRFAKRAGYRVYIGWRDAFAGDRAGDRHRGIAPSSCRGDGWHGGSTVRCEPTA